MSARANDVGVEVARTKGKNSNSRQEAECTRDLLKAFETFHAGNLASNRSHDLGQICEVDTEKKL